MARGLVVALAFALAAGLASGCGGGNDAFGVQMPSPAMLPAYKPGQELTVDRTAFENARPKVGEAVVFHAPVGAATGRCGAPRRVGEPCPRGTRTSRSIRLLLRVVAGPGQTVAFKRGQAIVDGEPQTSIRTRVDVPTCDICQLPRTITVPQNQWYLIADNRSASSDSRVWGPVPTNAIIGRVEDK